jgi:dihydroneopterin aldolase
VDKIIVAELPLRARVGVGEVERAAEQEILVDVELSFDVAAAGLSDDLRDTIDYERVSVVAGSVAKARPFHLLEAIAEEIARALLSELPVGEVAVRVRKPAALRAYGAAYAGVEIRRRRDG